MLSEGNAAHLQITARQTAITICRGQERPKGSTIPRIFLKSQCHHKIQEDSCEEIQVKLA
jgi:hypothetical protein